MNTKFTALLALFLLGLCLSQETNLRITQLDEPEEVNELPDEEEFNTAINKIIESYQSSEQGKCLAKSLTECSNESIQCGMNFAGLQICSKDLCHIDDEKKLDANLYKECITNTCQKQSNTLGKYSNQIYECLKNLIDGEQQKNVEQDNKEKDEEEVKGETQPKKPTKSEQKEEKEDQEVDPVAKNEKNKNSFSSLISLILIGINIILF
ncbi:hypothetical protein ABPG74_002027 [Tetrahymena malaccensis]